jgi:hypothetical protein
MLRIYIGIGGIHDDLTNVLTKANFFKQWFQNNTLHFLSWVWVYIEEFEDCWICRLVLENLVLADLYSHICSCHSSISCYGGDNNLE